MAPRDYYSVSAKSSYLDECGRNYVNRVIPFVMVSGILLKEDVRRILTES